MHSAIPDKEQNNARATPRGACDSILLFLQVSHTVHSAYVHLLQKGEPIVQRKRRRKKKEKTKHVCRSKLENTITFDPLIYKHIRPLVAFRLCMCEMRANHIHEKKKKRQEKFCDEATSRSR